MNDRPFKLNREVRRRIAEAFLPNRNHYYYARCKLASDPLYDGVGQALNGCEEPILDLGCGIGLLAHALAADGLKRAYLGLDNDAKKIAQAEAAAARAGLQQTRFACLNLSEANAIRDLHHRGSVVILDLLQYVPPEAQKPILEQATEAVSDTGRLIIRTGLADNTLRSTLTRAADNLGRKVGWMNTHPKSYPEKDALLSLLADAGLTSRCTPLWGKSPFNNWLIEASQPE